MNERVVKNPNFKNNGEFHRSLVTRGVGAKDWLNTHTEIEHLGEGKFAAGIGVGHRVFFDKADGNKPKKHKLTDERTNGKDYVLIQSAKCCVEVYPHYAKYFDVQHEEVRLYKERWVVQRLFKEPDTWRDVDAYNPVVIVEDTSNTVKATVTYDTDYGVLTVEYIQRDGGVLKHNVTFKNTSGSTETFRVLQRWAGIVGEKCNGRSPYHDFDEPFLAFHKADKSKRQFTIAENLSAMIFNPDGTEKIDQCLQRPVVIEAHPQGMKADFIYSKWVLADGESLAIDPDTATLNNPTQDGYLARVAATQGDCPSGTLTRHAGDADFAFGGTNIANIEYYASRAYVEWSISALAGATLTADPLFKYEGVLNQATSEEINPISSQPSVTADATLWTDIASGTAYVDPWAFVHGQNQEIDLGVAAKANLQTALTASQSWWAIGLQSPGNECSTPITVHTSAVAAEEHPNGGPVPPPTLYLVYTPPAAGLENKSASMGAKMIAGKLI